MPALPDVPKVLKVDFKFTYGSDTDVLTRQYWEYTGTAPTSTELATFGTAVGAGWDSNCASLTTTACSLEEMDVTDLSSPTAAQGVGPAVFPGTRSGAGLAADDCLVSGYEIARRFRGGHARGYWPFGVSTDRDSPQNWGAAFLTDAAAGIVGMNSDTEAAGWSGAGTLTQVSVSYYEGFTVVTSPTTHRARNVPTVRATPVVDPVTAILARVRIGTQRRRNGKG
uniref:Uncharacterized protein n=1 Tax=uncultured prokaryote TaxID=198431 RepID=A0A0H5Q5M4_9ZZZZ|nr:hypothetical protein [uncultured prokaryote]